MSCVSKTGRGSEKTSRFLVTRGQCLHLFVPCGPRGRGPVFISSHAVRLPWEAAEREETHPYIPTFARRKLALQNGSIWTLKPFFKKSLLVSSVHQVADCPWDVDSGMTVSDSYRHSESCTTSKNSVLCTEELSINKFSTTPHCKIPSGTSKPNLIHSCDSALWPGTHHLWCSLCLTWVSCWHCLIGFSLTWKSVSNTAQWETLCEN